MNPRKRKLTLHTQILRNLSTNQLGQVLGGIGSDRARMCSTWEDTGCYPTGNDFCNTVACPTQICITNVC